MENDYAVDELRGVLLDASRSAPYNSRSARQHQLEKNIQQSVNCAPETFIELLFSAQDLGVATETLLRVPETLAALIRARRPRTQQLSMPEFMKLETTLESELNPIQMEYVMGNRSTAVKRALLEKFRGYRETLDTGIAHLERECFEPPVRAAS